MFRKIEVTALLVLVCCVFVSAAQRQVFRIVPDTAKSIFTAPDDTVKIDWVELTDAGAQSIKSEPAEASVYFARTPAGGDLSRYTEIRQSLSANQPSPFFETGQYKRTTRFIPNRQGGAMGPGTYYVIVATVDDAGNTLYSDYMTVVVESQNAPSIISPKANLMATGQTVLKTNEMTPVFRWNRIDGVPYYHIMLSDGPILNMSGSEAKVSDSINIIWQAITPNASITYGAPDPSGTLVVSPPPLAPGVNYAWMVLNNYGNHMSYTSNVFDGMELLTAQFVIDSTQLVNRTPMVAPRVLSPVNNQSLNSNSNRTIEFRWDNIDREAVSYAVNVLFAAEGEELGLDGLGDITANTLIWEASVPRGNAVGNTALSITMDAAGTLTGGDYIWRVYAIDSRGMASTSNASVGRFKYAANSGTVIITASETLGGVSLPVGNAEIKTEVVSGPAQAPLAFSTKRNGTLNKTFPAGTYRFTISKDGYNTQTVTATLAHGANTSIPITMTRPGSVLFGRVIAAGADGSALSMAKVTAVSNWGDTLTAITGGNGGFRLSSWAGDWTITLEKAGYKRVSLGRISLRHGDNRDLGNIRMERNPLALSGVIRNPDGAPLTGAGVRLLVDGETVDELLSTPQNGSYVFYVMPGNYVLTAEKPGFIMVNRSVDVAVSREQDITLRSGAVVVNGTIWGRSWVASANPVTGGVPSGDFVTAPVGSAKVSFWEKTENGSPVDTFIVTTDPVFGRFTANLPQGKDYNVLIEAAGFDLTDSRTELLTADDGNVETSPWFSQGAGASAKTFSHTLNALVTIGGKVIGKGRPEESRDDGDGGMIISPAVPAGPLAGVNVFVYDENRRQIVSSARTSADGTYEIGNIPNGSYTVTAGMSGYFTMDRHTLVVDGGRPVPNRLAYDFEMSAGNGTVTWNIVGYEGSGVVNVMFPLNRMLDFVRDEPVRLGGVGPGEYVFEAVAESPNLLQLSRGTVIVPDNGEGMEVETEIYFPIEHINSGVLEKNGAGRYSLSVRPIRDLPSGTSIGEIELYYRSEGSVRFDRAVNNPGEYDVTFVPPKDGVVLQYYFVVHLSDGVTTYGSGKQLFTTYVKPDPREITRLAVIPETPGDTLVLPSSYAARFALKAYYGDLFTVIEESENIGNITWTLDDAEGERISSGNGRTFEITTPQNERFMVLTAELSPSSPYVMKSGRERTVTIPVRITGSSLASLSVRRRGEAGSITQNDNAAFVVEAFDGAGKLVSVTPQWSLSLAGAGRIDDEGVFWPNDDYVGVANIAATLGNVRAEYDGGQEVRYLLRGGMGGVADTRLGFKLDFGNADVVGEPVEFSVTVPELNNIIQKGYDFKVVGDKVFDVSASAAGRITGEVSVVIDVPPQFREAARKNDREFAAAKWFPDSLKWIPIAGSDLAADGSTMKVALKPFIDAPSVGRRLSEPKFDASVAASGLTARALYALVTRSNRFSVNLNISPHPFSPFIRPVREYGSGAPEGTCIKVDIESPESFVKSIKVHIYNSTGMRVWAVEKLNAETGENRFWWNGRTSGRGNARTSVSEEMWTEDFHQRTMNRPLARNGRYFVAVIVTDMEGKHRRVMKPLVLMK